MLCFIRFVLPIGSLLGSELQKSSDFGSAMEKLQLYSQALFC